MILYIFIFQFFLACMGAMMSQIFDDENKEGAYYLAIGQ